NCELRAILRHTRSPMYATAFYLLADIENGRISYAKAGHPNPMRLHRKNAQADLLRVASGTQGPPLGLFDDSRYATNESTLSAGEVILFYTDGVQEVFDRNEQQFGDEGLRASLLKRKDLELDSPLNGVISDAREF